MNIGFIGAGKVGFSLGKFFVEHAVSVTGYYSRSVNSAKEAAEFTGTEYYDSLEEIAKCNDVLFLTTPDGAIASVYNELRKLDVSGKEICHTSGSISAKDAFPDSAKYGVRVCSIHPLFPVSDKFKSYKELSRAFFCIEGDGVSVAKWKEILTKLNLSVQIISSDSKTRYHAAASIVSNMFCALAEEGVKLMASCGFTEKSALLALAPLMQTNLNHILDDNPINALTGPVERGDIDTVTKHLDCFNTDLERVMYSSLALKLVDMAKKKHSDKDFSRMESVLYTYLERRR